MDLLISHPSFLKTRRGMTLVELLIFAGLFSVISIIFVAILISVSRLQVRQGASTEVSTQSQFLLQNIQRLVEQSIAIEVPADVTTSTLKLRMADATDPTYVYISGTTAYLRETNGGTPQPLTSSRVQVTALNFVKRTNVRGKDAVAVDFTVSYNTQNIQQRFTQALDTTIARVSAATFDSDLRASSSNTFKIGAAAQEWQSINNTLFFGSTNNIGVGGGVPAGGTVKLQVDSGDLYVNSAGSGVILKNPGGTACVRLYYANTGQLATSSIACP
jgi:type II secretory pathway component PulJ